MLRPPYAWRELIEQIWFVARVSVVPTVVLSIPYTVLIVFTLNIVLIEVGAGDLSGAGAVAQQHARANVAGSLRRAAHLQRVRIDVSGNSERERVSLGLDRSRVSLDGGHISGMRSASRRAETRVGIASLGHARQISHHGVDHVGRISAGAGRMKDQRAQRVVVSRVTCDLVPAVGDLGHSARWRCE